MGRHQKALESYRSALTIYENIRKREDIMTICMDIADVLEKLNRPAEAMAYLKRYIAIRDSLFNADITMQVNELEQKYQASKKQVQIEALLKEQSMQELKNNRLQMFVYAGLAALLFVVSGFLVAKVRRQKKIIVRHREEKGSPVV